MSKNQEIILTESAVDFLKDEIGGGGATYTAGNGIDITNENVINADVKVLVVKDIEALTVEQCESLNMGDSVKVEESNYYVTQKDEQELYLTFIGQGYIISVLYVNPDDTWEFQSNITRDLGVGVVEIDREATRIDDDTLNQLIDFNTGMKPVFIKLTTENETDNYPILIPNDGLQYVWSSTVNDGYYWQLKVTPMEEGARVTIEHIQVGGGTEFYRHIIDFYGNDPTACTSGYIRVEIFNNQALGYTFETFVQYLIDNNYTISSNKHFPCFTGDEGQAYIDKCYVDNQDPSGVIIVTDVTIYRANSETTFSDTVLPFVVSVND